MLINLLALLSLSFTLAIPRAPIVLPPKNPNAPANLPAHTAKSVLVIGGGLSGLSAAMELAERGYQVTIRERSGVLGGRVDAHPKTIQYAKPPLTNSSQFTIEHGFHAFFNNYFTLRDIRDRLGVNHHFRAWDEVQYIFKDYKPELISSVGPYPLNILGILFRSPNLHLDSAIKSTLALPDLIWFNYKTIYNQYDNITFYEWAQQKKVDKKFYDIIMQPAMSVTVNDPDVISAATMLMFMHLYFLSDANSDKREVVTVPFSEALIDPWADYIRALGGKIKTKSSVSGLVFKEGKIVSTTDDLETLYDHIVMAADIPGVRSILGNSTVDEYSHAAFSELVDRSHRMGIAPHYKVMRVWFQGRLNASRPDILETPQHRPINLVARFDLLEKEFMEWAQENNGTVIEYHLYNIKNDWVQIRDPKEMWSKISPTAFEIYPELKDMPVLGFTIGQHDNFPSYAAKQEAYRPDTGFAYTVGIKNLAFAGDWLHTAYPSALMERAASTGREAANHILLQDGVRQVPIKVVNSHGPGLL